jgi:hypothetical protein
MADVLVLQLMLRGRTITVRRDVERKRDVPGTPGLLSVLGGAYLELLNAVERDQERDSATATAPQK